MRSLKETILLASILMSQRSLADSSYLINFGDDLWSSELLIETCPDMLKKAVVEIADSYSNEKTQLIAVLPKELGYQYFRVEFKVLSEGALVDLKAPLIYQFQYWTHRDEHEQCVKVEPYNITH